MNWEGEGSGEVTGDDASSMGLDALGEDEEEWMGLEGMGEGEGEAVERFAMLSVMWWSCSRRIATSFSNSSLALRGLDEW